MPKKKVTGLSKIASAVSAKPEQKRKVTLQEAADLAKQIWPDAPLSETEAQLGIPPEPEQAKLDLHDVVQVLDKTSKKFAQLAIVHTINGVNAVCYQPRYREKPESFILKVSDLHRIGPAHLKFKSSL